MRPSRIVARCVVAAALGASGASFVLADGAPEGLELSLTATTTKAWPCGPVAWELVLANRSKTATHPVVLSNDGSESGMREPSVWFTATHVGKDGVERELPPRPVGRCGLFATAWWKDVVKLAPGESRTLESAPMPPHQTFDYQDPGKLRLVAHYAWTGGRDKPKAIYGELPPEDLGGMRGVAAFELVSKPIEVEVVRPLDVVAKARRPFKSGLRRPLSEAIDVRVVNASVAPLTLAKDEWTLTVVNDDFVHARPAVEGETPRTARTVTIPAGGVTAVIGEAGFLGLRDVRLRFEGKGAARIAVALTRRAPESTTIRSNWVDVNVEE